jgi:NitT/TauT family transport system permease protein
MAHLEDAGRRSAQGLAGHGLKEETQPGKTRLEQWISVAVVVVFLIVWQLLAHFELVNTLFFPPPSLIFATLFEMIVSGELVTSLAITFSRLLTGFLIGGIPGLVLGLAMGWSHRLRIVIDPFIAIVHPIPRITVLPLLIIILGIGEAPRIALIAIGTFFPMLISSMAGVRQINPIYFEVASNYGASRWHAFRRIVLPGSLPMVMAGVRLGSATALLMTVIVELFTSREGVGYIIYLAWQTFRTDDLYAGLIVVALIGISLNLINQAMTNRLVPWQKEDA